MSIIPAYTYNLTNGTTADANQVMSNFNNVLNGVNNNAATNGVNSNITQITGLTTPLTVAQGGTGLGTLSANGLIIGNGTSTPSFLTTSVTNATAYWNGSAWTSGLLPIRAFLSGLTLSNDGSAPNSVLDISAGVCTDSTNVISINLGAFTKSTAGSWAAGSGSNGMGTGLTIAATTWYHVFAIINAGAADVYFDTSVTAANAPTSTTAFRRIGSFKTDGSSHILAFVQHGDTFNWLAPVSDISANNPGTSAVLRTLSVPLGVVVNAVVMPVLENISNGGNSYLYLSDPGTNDVAASPTFTIVPRSIGAAGGVVDSGGFVQMFTNTSSQIRSRLAYSDANVTLYINTLGWIDSRGKNN